jgi:hypothetical protein
MRAAAVLISSHSIYIWRRVQVMNLSLSNSLQLPIIWSIFGPNILLPTLFSNIFSPSSSLNVRDQVSHPYSTTGNIIVLYNYSYFNFYANVPPFINLGTRYRCVVSFNLGVLLPGKETPVTINGRVCRLHNRPAYSGASKGNQSPVVQRMSRVFITILRILYQDS